MRQYDLRLPVLRLPGGHHRQHRARAGGRRGGQRRAVPAQGMGARLPSRSDPRNVARAQHAQLFVLFLRGQRGAPPLGAGAGDRHRLPAQDTHRDRARRRQAHPAAHNGQH